MMVLTGKAAVNSVNPIVVRLMSQRGAPDEAELSRRMPGGRLEHGAVRFTTDEEPADVVVVLNYLKYDTRITARKGFIWNWHNEPINRTPFARGFDRVFTSQESADSRVVAAPPLLDWWIGKSWDELSVMTPPRKTHNVSAIASTKRMVAGHRLRHDFIETVEHSLPEVDVFGIGRQETLRDKWGGLAPYRYSIALENTSRPDYWTEKISDCFLSFTVPLYFGATNIQEYFPEDSYIWLPIDDPARAIDTLRLTLMNDSWESRVAAITEARDRVLKRYSLFGQVSRIVLQERHRIESSPMDSVIVHGRRTRPGGLVRNVGLAENLKVQARKVLSRMGTKKSENS